MSARREPQPHELELTNTCIKCKEVKPWIDFPWERKDGSGKVVRVHSACQACRAKYLRERRTEMRQAAGKPSGRGPERIPEPWEWWRQKVCALCEESKAWAFYSPTAYWPDGSVRSVASRCRTCRALTRSNSRKDPAKRRVYDRNWKRKRAARMRAEQKERGRYLPAGPFKEWLLRVRAEEGDLVALAEAAGLDEDTLGKVLERNSYVTERMADAVLIARGVHLHSIWPETQEAA